MADLRISELPQLLPADLEDVDDLAVADRSASETRRIPVGAMAQRALALVANGSIQGVKLATDSITATQIAPNAITAHELANGAVDTAALLDGAVLNAKLAAGIDGAKLSDNTVTAAKIPAASLDRGLDKTGGAIGHTNAVTAGTRSGITYDGQGHITAAAALVAGDLPAATATAIGGVSVPASSGLTVSGIGEIDHASAVAAGTRNGITYNATGHITATAALLPADLPVATDLAVGAARFPGPELRVTAGAVTHATSGVAAGTHTKVTVSSTGHVTGGSVLAAADIPNLDAGKITTGFLNPALIKEDSITRKMLADYSICFIQEASPPTTGVHAGVLWLQESTGQLRMWNSNSWFPIGFGRLSAENLRYCGTFNAATGAISGLTQFGVTEGFKIGSQIPTASDKLAGVYLVVATPGNGTAASAGTTFDNGDWILCNGATGGWVRVDTLNSPGGGGGATHLNDLLDVTISTGVVADDLLAFQASGQWVNVSELVGGSY